MSVCVFFFKTQTAYELRISDWSSDLCSSDLPVEIVVARQAGLLAGFDEDPRQRVDVAQVRDRERAVASVQVAGAAGIAFGAHETGQHAGPVPAVGALRGPVVVVAGDAADVAHRVDRTRTTQPLAARPPDPPVAEPWLRDGVEIGRAPV